ncbi:putative NUDIX hydrolase [Roseovarius albus]|uniref:Putative NUDIX hydrolase n=1 Tax=Roseovarius albus TaxID=1247867 RepID=A0A1X6Z692_9RHOB|nr:CoA pyrophosphatase [Roseovarius albus]SLN41604.1 putative NUDIX hydrolase [Roseovarius albus]
MTTEALKLIHDAIRDGGRLSSDYDLNPDVNLPAGRKLRPAAVLVPIYFRDGQARLILTKRSSALKHHPGQISFPGGKQDSEDKDLIATGLREASEEIGLNPVSVDVLGCLKPHETVTSFNVTPVIGVIRDDFTPIAEPGEVDEVFSVPLVHVLDPEHFTVEGRYWQGTLRRYYAVPYGPYYIWGATARMLRTLANYATQDED